MDSLDNAKAALAVARDELEAEYSAGLKRHAAKLRSDDPEATGDPKLGVLADALSDIREAQAALDRPRNERL